MSYSNLINVRKFTINPSDTKTPILKNSILQPAFAERKVDGEIGRSRVEIEYREIIVKRDEMTVILLEYSWYHIWLSTSTNP